MTMKRKPLLRFACALLMAFAVLFFASKSSPLYPINDWADAIRVSYVDEKDGCIRFMRERREIEDYLRAIYKWVVDKDLLSTSYLMGDEVDLPGKTEGWTAVLETLKELLPEIFEKGGDPVAIVEERGLGAVSDTAALEAFVDQAIAANPNVVEDYKAGKKAAAGFFVGQVMKLSKGKADPKMVGPMIAKKLASM